MPDAWIDAVLEPDVAKAIASLWRSSVHVLPEFVQYLVHETEALAIGRGDIGYVLIYAVRAFGEPAPRSYTPGFIFAGLPTPAADIDAFVASHGELPEALVALWRMHSFCRTKEQGFVASLRLESQKLVSAPRRLPGIRRAAPDSDEVYECLAIVDAGERLS